MPQFRSTGDNVLHGFPVLSGFVSFGEQVADGDREPAEGGRHQQSEEQCIAVMRVAELKVQMETLEARQQRFPVAHLAQNLQACIVNRRPLPVLELPDSNGVALQARPVVVGWFATDGLLSRAPIKVLAMLSDIYCVNVASIDSRMRRLISQACTAAGLVGGG